MRKQWLVKLGPFVPTHHQSPQPGWHQRQPHLHPFMFQEDAAYNTTIQAPGAQPEHIKNVISHTCVSSAKTQSPTQLCAVSWLPRQNQSHSPENQPQLLPIKHILQSKHRHTGINTPCSPQRGQVNSSPAWSPQWGHANTHNTQNPKSTLCKNQSTSAWQYPIMFPKTSSKLQPYPHCPICPARFHYLLEGFDRRNYIASGFSQGFITHFQGNNSTFETKNSSTTAENPEANKCSLRASGQVCLVDERRE